MRLLPLILVLLALLFNEARSFEDILPESSLEYQVPRLQNLIKRDFDKFGIEKDAKLVFKTRGHFQIPNIMTGEKLEPAGKIISSNLDNIFLSNEDMVFLTPIDGVKIGDIFSIYRSPVRISHSQSDRAGYVYYLVGEVKIINLREDLTVGRIQNATEPILRGYKVFPAVQELDRISAVPAAQRVEGVIVGSSVQFVDTISLNDICFIDRGKSDGVQVGNIFRAYEYYDRQTGNLITEENLLPVGDVYIVHVDDDFSTGLVITNNHPIQIGTVVALRTNVDDLIRSKSAADRMLDLSGVEGGDQASSGEEDLLEDDGGGDDEIIADDDDDDEDMDEDEGGEDLDEALADDDDDGTEKAEEAPANDEDDLSLDDDDDLGGGGDDELDLDDDDDDGADLEGDDDDDLSEDSGDDNDDDDDGDDDDDDSGSDLSSEEEAELEELLED